MATPSSPTPAETPSAIASQTQSTIKPAWKTSEGWLNLGTGILGALTAAGFIAGSGTVATVAGLSLSFAATLLHTWSRTTIKTAGQ